MCLIELAARASKPLRRALAPLALIGLLVACAGTPASAQPSATDDSRNLGSSTDGSSYTDYWELGAWVTPIGPRTQDIVSTPAP